MTALSSSTLKPIYDSVEGFFAAGREGAGKMAQLLALYGDDFITDDTVAFYGQQVRDAQMVHGMMEHIRRRTAYKLLQLQGPGPGARDEDGNEVAPEINADDIAGWVRALPRSPLRGWRCREQRPKREARSAGAS